MDRRVVRPLYDQVVAQGYQPGEILIVSMGGGPVQVGDERIKPIQALFAQLDGLMPNLEKVWAVAHTKVCGGIKHFCGDQPLAECLKPQYVEQATARALDPELYATHVLLPGAFRLLPERWRSHTQLSIAEPDETTQSVKLYSQWVTTDEGKTLNEIVTPLA